MPSTRGCAGRMRATPVVSAVPEPIEVVVSNSSVRKFGLPTTTKNGSTTFVMRSLCDAPLSSSADRVTVGVTSSRTVKVATLVSFAVVWSAWSARSLVMPAVRLALVAVPLKWKLIPACTVAPAASVAIAHRSPALQLPSRLVTVIGPGPGPPVQPTAIEPIEKLVAASGPLFVTARSKLASTPEISVLGPVTVAARSAAASRTVKLARAVSFAVFGSGWSARSLVTPAVKLALVAAPVKCRVTLACTVAPAARLAIAQRLPGLQLAPRSALVTTIGPGPEPPVHPIPVQPIEKLVAGSGPLFVTARSKLASTPDTSVGGPDSTATRSAGSSGGTGAGESVGMVFEIVPAAAGSAGGGSFVAGAALSPAGGSVGGGAGALLSAAPGGASFVTRAGVSGGGGAGAGGSVNPTRPRCTGRDGGRGSAPPPRAAGGRGRP